MLGEGPSVRAVERFSKFDGQFLDALDRFAGPLYQGAAYDDAIGQLCDGLGLLAGPDAKTDRQWCVSSSTHPCYKLGETGRDGVASAGDAGQRHKIDEALRLFCN